jgi:hypothetical protein
MRILTAYLVAFFTVGAPTTLYAKPKSEKLGITKSAKTVSGSETKVGDKSKNLKILPPWTMRKCPKNFFATYGMDGAKQLKKKDSACALWHTKAGLLEAQVTDQTSIIKSLKAVNSTHEAEHKLAEKRIQDLVKQVKTEIEEKNKYKYKPNFGWVYLSVGAALAAVGIAFGVGVWVAKE